MTIKLTADVFDYETEYEKVKRQMVKPNIRRYRVTGVGKNSLGNDSFNLTIRRAKSYG